jgi:hypothetical protein
MGQALRNRLQSHFVSFAAAQALKKISRSTLKWIEMLQHVQKNADVEKNAARTGGDDFEREIALVSLISPLGERKEY